MIIGVMGSNQIQHVIPILEKKYEVVNLQEILNNNNGWISIIKWLQAVRKVDIVYNVYTSPYVWKKALLCKLCGKKFISHWIGTDAFDAMNKKNKYKYIDYYFSCFESIQTEIQGIEIKSEVLPIFPYKMDFSLAQMPEKHACLIYMPTGKEQFYGFNIFKKVFSEFPDIPFYIVANSNKELFDEYKNVKTMGILSLKEMGELYNHISFVIRIPEHDGLSMSVIEALGKGKKVLWNYEYPYALLVKNDYDIIEKTKEIIKFRPKADYDANKFINDTFTVDEFIRIFNKAVIDIQKKKGK